MSASNDLVLESAPPAPKVRPRDLKFFREDGSPRWLRLYSNKGRKDETADCYTAVFSGRYPKPDGVGRWQMYLALGDTPFHPQGFCQHGEWTPAKGRPGQWAVDRPSYAHLGKPISWWDLGCDPQKAIFDDYMTLWRLGPASQDREVWHNESWPWYLERLLERHRGKSARLCPVCGVNTAIVNVSKDGLLVGDCGDAFRADRWLADE